MLSRLAAGLLRLPRRVLARIRRTGRTLYRIGTDRTMRPALGYLLSMGLGVASVVVFLLNETGRPQTPETVLLLASLALVMVTALSLGGGRPREE